MYKGFQNALIVSDCPPEKSELLIEAFSKEIPAFGERVWTENPAMPIKWLSNKNGKAQWKYDLIQIIKTT